MLRFFAASLTLLFCGGVAIAQAPLAPDRLALPAARSGDANATIIECIRSMPVGGHYAVSSAAFAGLNHAISLDLGGLRVDSAVAQPSFCSEATYLVFAKAVDRMLRDGTLALDQATLSSLLIAPHQGDGQGVWGRWNANGPGTARLFTELHLGRNFTEFADARPGDFMKIFWTAEIGQREHGHSVVYLGTNSVGGADFVRFWSSNIPSSAGDLSGYGVKLVPRTKIARAIFSRMENPANLARVRSIPKTDTFLASLLKRSVTFEEVRQMCEL